MSGEAWDRNESKTMLGLFVRYGSSVVGRWLEVSLVSQSCPLWASMNCIERPPSPSFSVILFAMSRADNGYSLPSRPDFVLNELSIYPSSTVYPIQKMDTLVIAPSRKLLSRKSTVAAWASPNVQRHIGDEVLARFRGCESLRFHVGGRSSLSMRTITAPPAHRPALLFLSGILVLPAFE